MTTNEEGAPVSEPEITVAVTLRRNTNFGDHGEYVTTAQALKPGETVRELATRLLADRHWNGGQLVPRHEDWIEIRIVQEPEPEPAPRPAVSENEPF